MTWGERDTHTSGHSRYLVPLGPVAGSWLPADSVARYSAEESAVGEWVARAIDQDQKNERTRGHRAMILVLQINIPRNFVATCLVLFVRHRPPPPLYLPNNRPFLRRRACQIGSPMCAHM